MKKEIILHTIICDYCNDDISKNYPFHQWENREEVEKFAINECGWITTIDSNHKCTNCILNNK